MYLVHDTDENCYVFLDDKPGPEFAGDVIEGVSLHDDKLAAPGWKHGNTAAKQVLTVAIDDPKAFRVFRHENELPAAGFRVIDASFAYDTSWTHYLSATGRGDL